MIDGSISPVPGTTDSERGRSLRQAARLTAIVGITFAVLYILSALIMYQVPTGNATDEEILAFYASPAAQLPLIVGLYIAPFAGICFIWFIVAVRMWAAASGRTPAILQSNLQLVSGIAFVILTFVAAAASTVVAGIAEVDGSRMSVDAARQFPIFGRAITLFFTMKMAAMYVFTTSLIGRGPSTFPNWFANAGFIVGAFLLLSPVFTPVLVLAFPIWIIVLCVIVFRGARRFATDIRIGDVINAGRVEPGIAGIKQPPPPSAKP